MKAPVARAIVDAMNGMLGVVNRRLAEVEDAFAEVDHRSGQVARRVVDHDRRISELEAIVADNANHSRGASEPLRCVAIGTHGQCVRQDGHLDAHRAPSGRQWYDGEAA